MRIGRGAAVTALGLVLALLSAWVVRDSTRLVGRAFPGFLLWDNGTQVALHTASWTGAAAGLPLNGGRVLAFDGEPLRDARALFDAVAAQGAGVNHSYLVRAGGDERSFRVPGTDRVLSGLIQVDASVNPGNSGGPLLDRAGRVIGIVSALINPSGGEVFAGIGLAVPIDVAGGAAGLPPY